MRYKSVNNLVPGDINAMQVVGSGGRVFIQQNVSLTSFQISRLKQMGRKGIYVFDDISDGIFVKQNIPMETKLEAAKALTNKDVSACLYIAKEITDNLIAGDAAIRLSAEELGNYDSMTYMHSVNVAVLCGTMGIILHLPYEKIKSLVLAGLLHDVGKMEVKKDILNKPDKLTSEEREEIEKHSIYGYNFLKQFDSVASVVRVSVLEHHENHDGTGYPYGLISNEIYEFAQIIHIVDVYDAMISKRVYKDELDPREVMEYIMGNSGSMFNPELVRTFVMNTVLYPEGVLVELSNNKQAIVVANNKDVPTRPIVRDIETGENIDLLDVYNLTITRIITD